jgi:hypothetical protein
MELQNIRLAGPAGENPVPPAFNGVTKDNSGIFRDSHGERSSPIFVFAIVLSSCITFVTIFALQITGLVYAVRGRHINKVEASWCSPMFTVFGVSALDLNCEFHTITGDPSKGIGCITLPGDRQNQWLQVTMVSLFLSILIEIADSFIMFRANEKTEIWSEHIKVKRPWFTILSGLAVLGLILAIGAHDAYTLPSGTDENIWLVVNATEPFICNGELTSAGLRGQFLGWLDGLLSSWGTTYLG